MDSLEGGPCHFSIKGNFLSLSSLVGSEPWEMESFLKQEARHQYLDGAVSGLSRKASFLASEAVACVYFNLEVHASLFLL